MEKIINTLPVIPPNIMEKAKQCFHTATEHAKTIDKKTLALSLTVCASFYALIFLYVYIYASSTIKNLESQLPTEIIPVHHKKKEETTSQLPTRTYPTDSLTIDGLYEKTSIGNLPIIRTTDNQTSFRKYQHPFTFKNIKKPVLSFVLLDYGLSKEQSETALDLLPPEVSFLLSPYAALPDEWIKMAQDKGHEVWMNLPIQNKKSTDSGKNTIFHHAPLVQKQSTMRHSLARAEGGYIGIGTYTDTGSETTTDHYLRLVDELYTRGLGIFELNPNAPPFIRNKGLALDAPYIKADLSISQMKGEKNSFDTLEKIAHKNGHAIAVIQSYPNTIKNLAAWVIKVAQADYIVAPVSAIYDLPLHKQHNTKNKPPESLEQKDHVQPVKNHH